jgi:hypothetical protein
VTAAPLEPESPEAASTEAPDLAGAIVAWRVWRLASAGGRYRLASVFMRAIWRPEEVFEATCRRAQPPWDLLRGRPKHTAPVARCSCGIYGAQFDLLKACLASTAECRHELGVVLGQVSLWGTVVECERGYRASLAYPRRLYLPVDATTRHREDVAYELCEYRVPVELLEVPWTHARSELEQRARQE